MPAVTITAEEFLQDSQGRTFADVVNDSDLPFGTILEFFNDEVRQKRMEESEIHHDRSALAGVIRELEAQPEVERFFSEVHHRKSNRIRQAVGVLVRMIMESRGWRKTGRKGSLGVRAPKSRQEPKHNTGGLAFWFLRAERYELCDGMPFESVRKRYEEFNSTASQKSSA